MPKGDLMNVAYCCNRYYLPYTMISISSLLQNGRDGRDVRILLAADQSLKREELEPIFQLVSRFPGCSMRAEWPQKRSDRRFVSDASCCIPEGAVQTACFRLLLPRMLAGEERCLYLDGDLVVRKPLTELYDTDLTDCCLAGVTDRLCLEESPLKRMKEEWGIEPGHYINAGVLMMNLERMRNTGCAGRAEELAYSVPFRYLDQDVLNQVCRGQIRLIPKRYDVFPDDTREDLRYLRELMPEHAGLFPDEALASPAIVHYIGVKKPWHTRNVNYGEYWQEAERGYAAVRGQRDEPVS